MGISLSEVSVAMMYVWPNPFLTDLHRDNTAMYGNTIPVSDTQMDMLGKLRTGISFFSLRLKRDVSVKKKGFVLDY